MTPALLLCSLSSQSATKSFQSPDTVIHAFPAMNSDSTMSDVTPSANPFNDSFAIDADDAGHYDSASTSGSDVASKRKGVVFDSPTRLRPQSSSTSLESCASHVLPAPIEWTNENLRTHLPPTHTQTLPIQPTNKHPQSPSSNFSSQISTSQTHTPSHPHSHSSTTPPHRSTSASTTITNQTQYHTTTHPPTS